MCNTRRSNASEHFRVFDELNDLHDAASSSNSARLIRHSLRIKSTQRSHSVNVSKVSVLSELPQRSQHRIRKSPLHPETISGRATCGINFFIFEGTRDSFRWVKDAHRSEARRVRRTTWTAWTAGPPVS